MSKSIDVLAKEEASLHFNKEFDADRWWACVCCFKAGYKQRNDELIDLLVELEEYFEKRQDADWEGEETGMVPNKEMWFYAQIKEVLDKL